MVAIAYWNRYCDEALAHSIGKTLSLDAYFLCRLLSSWSASQRSRRGNGSYLINPGKRVRQDRDQDYILAVSMV